MIKTELEKSEEKSNTRIANWIALLSMLAVCINGINNWFKERADIEYQARQATLQERQLRFEEIKLMVNSYEKEQQDLAERASIISSLQIQMVDLRNFCSKYGAFSLKEKQKINFYKKLELMHTANDYLIKKFAIDSALLKPRYGIEVHNKAKKFIDMALRYGYSTCEPSQEIPPLEQWIQWQNATIDAINNYMDIKYKRYNDFFYKGL